MRCGRIAPVFFATTLAVGLAIPVVTHADPPAPTPRVAGTTLTPAGLAPFLKKLGYEPKRARDGMVYVSYKVPGYTLFVRFSFSGDSQKLWLDAKLGPATVDQVPAADLVELLACEMGTARFWFCDCSECKGKPVRQLWVSQPFDNHGVTPSAVREELKEFSQTIIHTAPLWERCLAPKAPTNASR